MESLIDRIISSAKFIYRGAESDLYEINFLGRKAILKWRRPKPYRIPELDFRIRKERTIREVSIMIKLRKHAVNVPGILHVSPEENAFIMEKIEGEILREFLLREGYKNYNWIAEELGRTTAKIHSLNIMHGDLTTSNLILSKNDEIYIIDFGLSIISERAEEKAVDIELLYRVLESTHTKISKQFFKIFTETYIKEYNDGNEVLRNFEIIRKMGRYIPKEERRWK